MRPVYTLVCLALLVLLGSQGVPAQSYDFQVVVNDANPMRSIGVDHLERIFLKKTTRWEDGSRIEPVDQAPDRTVRERFSDEVLGKDPSAVKSYWQRQLFSGRETPPPELDSDRQVLDYVASNRYAIGYVSSGVALGSGVKQLSVTD